MDRVIFACVHNAGRSQMAGAFFNMLATSARADSAGTSPAKQVYPEVVASMAELGFDLSKAEPKKLTAELAAGAHLLITMGCGETCPYVPGLLVEDWPIADPIGANALEVRLIRDEILRRVRDLIQRHCW
jgi:arsenate reductase (thioredoxin)